MLPPSTSTAPRGSELCWASPRGLCSAGHGTASDTEGFGAGTGQRERLGQRLEQGSSSAGSLNLCQACALCTWWRAPGQGSPQGGQGTGTVCVTSGGATRTVPLSAHSSLSQTLSPLSCWEDLEPWQKSAGCSCPVSPTLRSTHKLSPGLHSVTAGSAARSSVLK